MSWNNSNNMESTINDWLADIEDQMTDEPDQDEEMAEPSEQDVMNVIASGPGNPEGDEDMAEPAKEIITPGKSTGSQSADEIMPEQAVAAPGKQATESDVVVELNRAFGTENIAKMSSGNGNSFPEVKSHEFFTVTCEIDGRYEERKYFHVFKERQYKDVNIYGRRIEFGPGKSGPKVIPGIADNVRSAIYLKFFGEEKFPNAMIASNKMKIVAVQGSFSFTFSSYDKKTNQVVPTGPHINIECKPDEDGVTYRNGLVVNKNEIFSIKNNLCHDSFLMAIILVDDDVPRPKETKDAPAPVEDLPAQKESIPLPPSDEDRHEVLHKMHMETLESFFSNKEQEKDGGSSAGSGSLFGSPSKKSKKNDSTPPGSPSSSCSTISCADEETVTSDESIMNLAKEYAKTLSLASVANGGFEGIGDGTHLVFAKCGHPALMDSSFRPVYGNIFKLKPNTSSATIAVLHKMNLVRMGGNATIQILRYADKEKGADWETYSLDQDDIYIRAFDTYKVENNSDQMAVWYGLSYDIKLEEDL